MGQQWHFRCDWCGFDMVEQQCKVVCRNCGARWDCSDLTIRLTDIPEPSPPADQSLSRQPGGGDD